MWRKMRSLVAPIYYFCVWPKFFWGPLEAMIWQNKDGPLYSIAFTTVHNYRNLWNKNSWIFVLFYSLILIFIKNVIFLFLCHIDHMLLLKKGNIYQIYKPIKNCKEVNSTFDSFENFIAPRCGYGPWCADICKKVWIDLYLNL